MAKDNSAEQKRNRARENARQIAAAQAKKEKTAKVILYSGIGVVVVAVAVIVTLLVVQSAKPATRRRTTSQAVSAWPRAVRSSSR